MAIQFVDVEVYIFHPTKKQSNIVYYIELTLFAKHSQRKMMFVSCIIVHTFVCDPNFT